MSAHWVAPCAVNAHASQKLGKVRRDPTTKRLAFISRALGTESRPWVTRWVIFSRGQTERAGTSEEVQRKLFTQNDLCRAGDGTRTRDIKLGRLALYQLSYSRIPEAYRDRPRPTSRVDAAVRQSPYSETVNACSRGGRASETL